MEQIKNKDRVKAFIELIDTIKEVNDNKLKTKLFEKLSEYLESR